MGRRLRATQSGWGRVSSFAVFSDPLTTTVEGARSIKPELIEVCALLPPRSEMGRLWREVMVPYTFARLP